MLVLFVISVGASIYAYNWARDYIANQFREGPVFHEPTPAPIPTVLPGTPVVEMAPRGWDGKERVNLLLMGIDQRDGEVEPAYRTDTMMVLTLDPVTLDAGVLSIPRDLWVPIPGYDNGRINTANFVGDAYGYPGGGSALAVKTVEQMLGVPIHFYARVNFTAFEDIIDRIGGIDINVPYDIYDPKYPTADYRTEVFSITQGMHHMDGELALKFARTRYTLTNGDFDRARNQQLVLKAVKQKLKDPLVLLSLFAAAPEIVAKLSASVKTNMSVDQMQQLATVAIKVNTDLIKSAVLDQDYTEFATTLTNPPQQVQIPIRARIAELRDTFFSVTPNGAAETTAATDQPGDTDWHSEKARVAVLNATPTAGYAQQVADYLEAKGFNIVRIGNPADDEDYKRTEITDYAGKPLTAKALAAALNVQGIAQMQRIADPSAREDIVIIVGPDVKLP